MRSTRLGRATAVPVATVHWEGSASSHLLAASLYLKASAIRDVYITQLVPCSPEHPDTCRNAGRTLVAALLSVGDARPAVITKLCSQDPALGSAPCMQVRTRARCMGKHCRGACTPTPCTLQAHPCRGTVCAHACSMRVTGHALHRSTRVYKAARCSARMPCGHTHVCTTPGAGWHLEAPPKPPLLRSIRTLQPLVQPAGAKGEDAKKSGRQSVRVLLPRRITRALGEDAGSAVHPAGPKHPRDRQSPEQRAKGRRGLSPHLPRCHLRAPAPRTRSRSRTGRWPRRLLWGSRRSSR